MAERSSAMRIASFSVNSRTEEERYDSEVGKTNQDGRNFQIWGSTAFFNFFKKITATFEFIIL